jgi:MazG family protein
MSTGPKFERAVEIMARLRAPGGCPWDREQTFDTIKPYTLEEAYEVVEAIDKRDWDELKGELGDLLLQVLFYAEMAQEEKRFGIDEVLETLSDKLVRRHPHVFGDVSAETSGEVLRNWEQIKKQERNDKADAAEFHSVLDGVSSAQPALMEAYKISSRAANVGFDWPNIDELFAKLHEEIDELKAEVKEYPAPGPNPRATGVAGARGAQIPDELRARLEDEVGDLFFVLVNIARYLTLDPESALRRMNRKFKQRFQFVERELHARGTKIEHATLEEMEALWQQAKKQPV